MDTYNQHSTLKQYFNSVISLDQPVHWHEYYRISKLVANMLLEKLRMDNYDSGIHMDINNTAFVKTSINAYYHLGIALEIGLNGMIGNSHNTISYPKSHRMQGTSLKQKTQNLLQLADEIGLFKKNRMDFKSFTDYENLKQVLLHLSDIIKWNERYPYPESSTTLSKLSNKIPFLIFNGSHITQMVQPLFDLLESEIEKN
ncbi:hypothetical protein HMPREF0765_2396 [Sphingobacterium spiritivorum ATCC 33300]|uniref:Uncharacterized protein n=1 Tax=Sphingobacterium spiritivorum ATCC 33300 TaxID=525372 RepID=C2FYJ0_SPHSI|nr:hypothetical protein [Sphingobacterium spiritivorum]EEI92010.1 hypothetical protein HMPREF0765_2396 [Sphingobacterium spiritivorum ATCC 33300]QQS96518.1 hypothetical protein I6J03_02065 [Sphingobacterium spiritivorum]